MNESVSKLTPKQAARLACDVSNILVSLGKITQVLPVEILGAYVLESNYSGLRGNLEYLREVLDSQARK